MLICNLIAEQLKLVTRSYAQTWATVNYPNTYLADEQVELVRIWFVPEYFYGFVTIDILDMDAEESNDEICTMSLTVGIAVRYSLNV